jgi:rSAM-associated Gly-rich repeat protein
MTTPRRTLKALAALLPLGAFGISVALAAAPAKPFAPQTDDSSAKPDVATRLAAVRTGVSQVIAAQEGLPPGDPNIVKTWWGNWRPGWGNGGWRNWGNGGWHNWGNGWGNGGWHNWPNFWRNW